MRRVCGLKVLKAFRTVQKKQNRLKNLLILQGKSKQTRPEYLLKYGVRVCARLVSCVDSRQSRQSTCSQTPQTERSFTLVSTFCPGWIESVSTTLVLDFKMHKTTASTRWSSWWWWVKSFLSTRHATKVLSKRRNISSIFFTDFSYFSRRLMWTRTAFLNGKNSAPT